MGAPTLGRERPDASSGAMHTAAQFDYAAHLLERGRFDPTYWRLDGKRLDQSAQVSIALAVTLRAPAVAERARDGDFEMVGEARDAAWEQGAAVYSTPRLYAMADLSGPVELARSLADVADASTLLVAADYLKWRLRAKASERRRWRRGSDVGRTRWRESAAGRTSRG